jgi:hypothetical protein
MAAFMTLSGPKLPLESRVRLPVGHHAARGDDPTEPRRIDEVPRGHAVEVVARGGDEAQTGEVRAIDALSPRLRWQAAHAHRRNIALDVHGVVERAREGARVEQDHGVGDAKRDDLGVGRAADPDAVGGGERPAGQDA